MLTVWYVTSLVDYSVLVNILDDVGQLDSR